MEQHVVGKATQDLNTNLSSATQGTSVTTTACTHHVSNVKTLVNGKTTHKATKAIITYSPEWARYA